MGTGMRSGEIAEAGARLLGAALADCRAVAGGDLSAVVWLRLATGDTAIAKTGPDPRAEAAMLDAIRTAGVPAPQVLAVSDRVLVLEELPDRGGLDDAGWRELGVALRCLHGAEGEDYGWPVDYAFGAVAIRNAPGADWPSFWAEQRLLSEVAAMPAGFARRLEALARDLPNRLPARPAPALLHGDLWAGNLLAADGRLSGQIDPACYFGHGEVDLAMLHLFGSPGAGFAAGYGALDPGAAERRAIYQLWPAIVHLRLFGAGYAGMLDRLLVTAGV